MTEEPDPEKIVQQLAEFYRRAADVEIDVEAALREFKDLVSGALEPPLVPPDRDVDEHIWFDSSA